VIVKDKERELCWFDSATAEEYDADDYEESLKAAEDALEMMEDLDW